MKGTELEDLLKAVADQDSLALSRMEIKANSAERAIAELEKELASFNSSGCEIASYHFSIANYRYKHRMLMEQKEKLKSHKEDSRSARNRLKVSFGKLTAFRAVRKKYRIL